MKKKLLFVCIVMLASANTLFCQYWQEQIVLKGNVITQCFDENEDVLFSSELSNGKFAVCRYSVEKDSIDKVLLVTNNAVEFLEVLTDGTIMAFQNHQLLKSTDKGDSWVGIKNDITVSKFFRIPFLKEINDTLIFWEFYGYHITFDQGLTWDSISYQSKQLLHIEPTYNSCLVGIENEKKYPIFSSDFGKTWETTNLDTIQLFHFIYSEKIRTIFAISRNNGRMLYKSMNAGKDWEIIEIPTDTLIASYDVDSEGNLFIMDFKNNLYKWFTTTNDLELLSSMATFNFYPNLPYYKESYRTGVFLDKTDNIFYYDIFDYKIYKFDYISKKWLDTVDIIHDDKPGTTFITSSFKFSKQADKVIINSRDEGLQLVLLNNKFLTSIKVPTGAEPTTDKYELGPNGELVFANFRINYVPDSDSINTYIANYSISSDNGFSRKVFLSDSIIAYDSNSGLYYSDLYDFSNMTFLNNNLFIIGYNKTFNINLSDMKTETLMNPEFQYRISSIVGASPDSTLYTFSLNFLSLDDYRIKSQTQSLFISTNFGYSWELVDSNFSRNYHFVKNIQFQSNGTIFINTIDIDWQPFYFSNDKGKTWTSHGGGHGSDVYSLFTDNKDNLYYNSSSVTIPNTAYKNWNIWKDTVDVVATKCGDIFAIVYLEGNSNNSISIYSSDYGVNWINYDKWYDRLLKSNDKGDVYKYYKEGSRTVDKENILHKLSREPNPKPHPLSDTTVYTVFVDVEDLEENVAGEIFIFPNPANEYIEINMMNHRVNPMVQGFEIEIFNVLGERVKAIPIHPMTRSHRMNISDLVQGVYFVRIGKDLKMFVKN